MDTSQVLKIVGAVAGIGGLGIGVFFLLLREVIRARLFPKVPQKEITGLLRLMLILIWSIAVVGIIAWLLGIWIERPGEDRLDQTTLFLSHSDGIVEGTFDVTYRVGNDQREAQGDNGRADLIVRDGTNSIDELSIRHSLYRAASPGPYPIVNGEPVRVKVVESGVLDPLSPSEFRDPRTLFENFPTMDEVRAIDWADAPAGTTLYYKNSSDRSLRLLLVDVSRQYRTGNGWHDFPFPANNKEVDYSDFISGAGLYCFAVRDREGKWTPLGCASLFDKKVTRLEVFSRGDVLQGQLNSF